MKKRNAYPHYRDSGIEWLGGVPAHGRVKRLKVVASTNDEALSDAEDPLRVMFYVDISAADATRGITRYEELVFEDAPSRARRLVRDGDTIVSTVRTYLRAIAPIDSPKPEMVVSTGFAVIRPRAIDADFASWVLREQGFLDEIVARSVGVSYPAINAPEIGNLPIAVPPLDEQRAIAAFLDGETERIDSLVAKKRLLLERLQEYRTALITRTVTRGLPPAAARAAGFDPSPRLKPSGVEWLGDVPEHWDVKALRRAIRLQRGHDLPSEQREEGAVPVLSSAGMFSSHVAAVARGPGIVRGRYGAIGEFHLVDGPYWPLNTTLYTVELYGNEVRFLRYLSINLKPLFVVNAAKSAVPGVDRNDVHPVLTAVPPIREQRAIADYLDSRLGPVSRSVASAEGFVERLQEYRSALITSAVTGKIDMRVSATIVEGSAELPA